MALVSRPREWLIDSGSCFDIPGDSDLDHRDRSRTQVSDEGVILATANGPTVARNKVALNLGPPFGDYRVDPIVLKDSPPVLSMGRMVTEHGCTFHWGPDHGASLAMPDGRVIGLDVRDNVPVMSCPARWPCSGLTCAPWPERVGPIQLESQPPAPGAIRTADADGAAAAGRPAAPALPSYEDMPTWVCRQCEEQDIPISSSRCASCGLYNPRFPSEEGEGMRGTTTGRTR